MVVGLGWAFRDHCRLLGHDPVYPTNHRDLHPQGTHFNTHCNIQPIPSTPFVHEIMSTTINTISSSIPSFLFTCVFQSMGALSIPMMLIQTPGAILITVSLALRPGANWTTWISYAITALLQIILLGLCLFYAYQIRKRRALRKMEEQQQQQQQPLLLTQSTIHPSIPIPILQETSYRPQVIGESTPLLSAPV